ncbi:hypothetical protein J4406_00565 [Candidatus Woesearchaeota archaeon]|nr:hypothetical protein [Candidatus Woesearchaeota archaeon]
MLGIKKIAEILFIILALLIIIIIIFGYGTQLKESIQKLFGIKTESKTIHEQNIQSQEEFKNLMNHVENCKNSKDISCGCTFNIKKYNQNQMILSRTIDLQLVDITNTKKEEAIKEFNFGIPLEKADIKNTNCYFDKDFEKNDVNVARIFFDKEKPYLHSVKKLLLIPWQTEIYLNTEFPLYKNPKGNICWLSEKAQNIKECQ